MNEENGGSDEGIFEIDNLIKSNKLPLEKGIAKIVSSIKGSTEYIGILSFEIDLALAELEKSKTFRDYLESMEEIYNILINHFIELDNCLPNVTHFISFGAVA